MLRALRAEAAAALSACPAWRKPALRRSREADFLLATDLPLAADAAVAEAFIRQMQGRGWRVAARGGWLLLDHALPAPVDPGLTAAPGEMGCALWLLRRHPGGEAPADALRALAKASESGEPALERLCRDWHGTWAASLRLRQPLPGRLAPYLAMAIDQQTKRRLQE